MAELDRILRGRLVRSVFQPIVRLDDGVTVGFEALARAPAGPVRRPRGGDRGRAPARRRALAREVDHDRYDFVLTYDRPRVARIARSLMSRLGSPELGER